MTTVVVVAGTDDEVFAAFAQGDELEGDTTQSLGYGCASNTVLVSHGVPLAVRSEDVVAFDARPAFRDGRCVCRLMRHVGRAGVFVHAEYADHEVVTLDHGAFVDLCGRLGVV